MSSQPSPVISSTPPVVHHPIFPRLSAFIKAHEMLLGLVLAAVLVWGVAGKVHAYYDAKDTRAQITAHETAQANADKVQAVADQNAKAAADYKQLAESVLAQNTALNAAMAANNQRLATQQATDKVMAPPELAARWQVLADLPLGSVNPGLAGAFTVTGPAAVTTIVALEQVPVLKQNLASETTIAANTQKQLDSATGRIDGLNQQIGGLNVQIVENDKVCKADAKVVADKNRKSKGKWFAAGAITVAAGRIALKLFTGI